MGTSADRSAGSGGAWTPLKLAATAYIRSLDAGNGPRRERAARLLARHVPVLGGASGAAASARAGRTGLQRLGGLLSGIGESGLAATLEAFGLGELVGRDRFDVLDSLVTLLAGNGDDTQGWLPSRRSAGPANSASSTSNTATATNPRPWCPTAAPRPRRSTTSACTSRPRGPAPRLPHAWIDDEDGNRRAIKDLVAPGRFLLIAGEDGHSWCEAARQLASESRVPIDTVRIGHLDGDLYDPHCTWLRHRDIASDGAVLVRPDRFIAWRHPAGTTEPQAALSAALTQILARPVGAQAGVAVGLR